jgi:hypothetical protein
MAYYTCASMSAHGHAISRTKGKSPPMFFLMSCSVLGALSPVVQDQHQDNPDDQTENFLWRRSGYLKRSLQVDVI